MRASLKLYTSTIIAAMLFGCKGNGSSIKLSVKAKSGEGFPVAGASISIDDELIGETNSFGTFSSTIQVPDSKRHKLSLTKNDEKYYFAPHIETFITESGETKNLSIDALMYTVPKPKKSKNEYIDEKIKDSNPTGSSTMPEDQSQSIFAELPLVAINEDQISISDNNLAAREKSTDIFTVHVYSGRFPVSQASVTFLSQTGESFQCTSNERGRCVLEMSLKLPVEGTLIVQREGYRSLSTHLEVKESSNHRLNMEPGSSLDVMAEVTGPWISKPADNVELRVKNKNQAIPQVATDKTGFVTTPIEAIFPIEVELTNTKTGARQKHTVIDLQGLRIKANFSDESTTGWAKWTRYPIHLSKDAAKNSGLVDYEHLEETLKRKYPDHSEDSKRIEASFLSRGEIALLPIVRKDQQGFELGIMAFTAKGKIAESLFTSVPLSSVTEDQWLNAYDTALKNLNQKLPWAGTVKGIKNRELIVSMNTDYINTSDRISIDTPFGPMSGTITRLNRSEVRVSMDTASHLNSNDLNKIIGCRAQKIVHAANFDTKADVDDIHKLVSIKVEHKSRRLAKKYLAESNYDEAVQILLSSTSSSEPSLGDLQLAASIENNRGNTTKVLAILKKMLSQAAEHRLFHLIPIIETNILLVQVESMPSIAGDKDAAQRFTEIQSQAEQLKAELSITAQYSQQSIALTYISLTAQQKSAESKADILALATMADAWKAFEGILGVDSGTSESNAWRVYASRQRLRSSFDHSSEKTSL